MTTLILDSFAGTNGDNVNGRTPDTTNTPGNTWSVVLGTFEINSNKANSTTNGDCRAVIDSGVADGVISIVVAVETNAKALLFRYSDASNWWMVHILASVGWGLRIYKIDTGSGVLMAQGATDLSVGNFTVTVTLSGNSITASISGGDTISVSGGDAFNNTATKHGIRTETFAGLTHDSFQVDGTVASGTTASPGVRFPFSILNF